MDSQVKTLLATMTPRLVFLRATSLETLSPATGDPSVAEVIVSTSKATWNAAGLCWESQREVLLWSPKLS